jgi:hypothetical protein
MGSRSIERSMYSAAMILFLFPRLAFRRAARPHVAPEIWRETLRHQRELAPRRLRSSPGLTLVLRYLEWDCALYRALRASGASTDAAGQVIEEVNWRIFGPPIGLAFRLSRLRSARVLSRVRFMIDAMFFALFTAPFERRKHADQDAVAFDVVACPLAAYLKAQGVPELTRYAACSLDYRMARMWGVELRRTQTIAGEAPLCDFRFQIGS